MTQPPRIVLTSKAPDTPALDGNAAPHDPGILSIEVNPTQLERPMLQFILDYWHQKRCGRALPLRSDLRMSDLKHMIGNILICEAVPGRNDFRYRLIGTRITDFFLGDATGMTVRETYALGGASEAFVDTLIGYFRTMCETQTPHFVKGVRGIWRDRAYPDYDALYLPLAADDGTASMVLTAYAFSGVS